MSRKSGVSFFSPFSRRLEEQHSSSKIYWDTEGSGVLPSETQRLTFESVFLTIDLERITAMIEVYAFWAVWEMAQTLDLFGQ